MNNSGLTIAGRFTVNTAVILCVIFVVMAVYQYYEKPDRYVSYAFATSIITVFVYASFAMGIGLLSALIGL